MSKKRIIIISIIVVVLVGIGAYNEFKNSNDNFSSSNIKASDLSSVSKATTSTAPSCTHKWIDATCELPKTCSECGETIGISLGHDYQEENCTTDSVCVRCNKVEKATGHKWKDATCSSPKLCTVCGKTEGKAIKHDFEGLSCVSDGVCKYCGEIKKAEEHSWIDATCREPKTCKNCGRTSGKALRHTTEDGECERCGKIVHSGGIRTDENGNFVIYITPTGKKYHYDPHCNGGTYIESTLSEAQGKGLEPCKKCVGKFNY